MAQPVKASTYNAGDPSSIPGWGRSPGEGNGNPLQFSCLENPMDGGAWQAIVHGVAKSRTRLSDFTSFTFDSAAHQRGSGSHSYRKRNRRACPPHIPARLQGTSLVSSTCPCWVSFCTDEATRDIRVSLLYCSRGSHCKSPLAFFFPTQP